MKARPDRPADDRANALGDPSPTAPAAPSATPSASLSVLAAARAQLDAWHRQDRHAAMAKRLTTTLLIGGLAAAVAGGFCAAGLCPWLVAALAGVAGMLVALIWRRPWRGLPAPADTALWLERRKNWQSALSTLLLLSPDATAKRPAAVPALSAAAQDFAAWLAPRLPDWRTLRLPRLPSNLRYLALPPCLLLAEWLLGQAAVPAPEDFVPAPEGQAAARPIVAVLPGVPAENAPRLPPLATEALPAEAPRRALPPSPTEHNAPRTDRKRFSKAAHRISPAIRSR